jgi:PQQ-dependent dehydrogenase (methanol/ethanol family)
MELLGGAFCEDSVVGETGLTITAKNKECTMKRLVLILPLLLTNTLAIADELLELQQNPNNWVMPAGNYNNQRYSKLDQINKDNVQDLKMAWSFSTGVLHGHEGNTLIIDGTMYVHTPFPNNVFAIDAYWYGAIKWKYSPKQNLNETAMCCDTVNRGLAYADGKIFLNQADTTLVALDMHTGNVIWQHQRDDPKRGATSTGAAHVFTDKVLVGISGGDYGIRGYIKAYDLDGKEQWQVYNTGPDAEMGFDPETTTSVLKPVGKDSSLKTWQGDQWQIGGGTTWGWFSYDPDLNLFYHGSGNPSNWNPVQRPGDNKWTSSIFARDLDTGKANWVYQMTPHDEWGYDGVNEIILVDQKINDKMQKTAVHFDANGFSYTMDRTNGELLVAENFQSYKPTWSNGINSISSNSAAGVADRVRKFSTDKTDGNNTIRGVCPSHLGAKGQAPAAYSPRTGLFYVPINRICMDYEPFEVQYEKGQPYANAITTLYASPGGLHLGQFVAWDAREGKIVWSNPELFSVWGGAVATAGDLVFYGTLQGFIKAVDVHSGRELWRFKTPSGIIGNVNTYKHEGHQYLSVFSGISDFANESMNIPLPEETGLGDRGAYLTLSNWAGSASVLNIFSLTGD